MLPFALYSFFFADRALPFDFLSFPFLSSSGRNWLRLISTVSSIAITTFRSRISSNQPSWHSSWMTKSRACVKGTNQRGRSSTGLGSLAVIMACIRLAESFHSLACRGMLLLWRFCSDFRTCPSLPKPRSWQPILPRGTCRGPSRRRKVWKAAGVLKVRGRGGRARASARSCRRPSRRRSFRRTPSRWKTTRGATTCSGPCTADTFASCMLVHTTLPLVPRRLCLVSASSLRTSWNRRSRRSITICMESSASRLSHWLSRGSATRSQTCWCRSRCCFSGIACLASILSSHSFCLLWPSFTIERTKSWKLKTWTRSTSSWTWRRWSLFPCSRTLLNTLGRVWHPHRRDRINFIHFKFFLWTVHLLTFVI